MCGTVPIALASVSAAHHNQSSNDHKAPRKNKYRTGYPIALESEGKDLHRTHVDPQISLGL